MFISKTWYNVKRQLLILSLQIQIFQSFPSRLFSGQNIYNWSTSKIVFTTTWSLKWGKTKQRKQWMEYVFNWEWEEVPGNMITLLFQEDALQDGGVAGLSLGDVRAVPASADSFHSYRHRMVANSALTPMALKSCPRKEASDCFWSKFLLHLLGSKAVLEKSVSAGKRGRPLPRKLSTQQLQYTCFKQQVPGWSPLVPERWSTTTSSWITFAICFRNHHQSLCNHNCQSVQIVIKILIKENQQPFIVMEEWLLTAFISAELHGKPEKAHCLCVLSCKSWESVLRLRSAHFRLYWRAGGKSTLRGWGLSSHACRSCFQMLLP